MRKRVTIKASTFILVGSFFCLLIIIAKLFYVSLSPKVDGINLKKFAENRNEKTKKLYASRGTIYDKNGDALALSVNSYTLFAYLSDTRTTDPDNPQHVVDKGLTASLLAPILGTTEDVLLGYLNKDAYQVEFGKIGKGLTESVKKQIDALNLPGLDFIVGTQRYYKMGKFASYIVGYAKTNEDGEINGELGIESYFNKELSGKDGHITYQSDAYGYQLPNMPYIEEPAQSGENIYLTIDSNIQLIAENAIASLEKDYKFEYAIMTIIDAKTGAIVASSTSPNFNPNDLNTLKSYLNPLVSYTYEPGSVMKIFSWASSIEDGFYDGNKTFESGCIPVADVTVCDANKKGWGTISFDTGFAYSSNVGATLLSRSLGGKKLLEYYKKYGFGKKTGIELSGEVVGDLDFKYESEIAAAAFGQGITVTPIQLIQALTAIANDGKMLKPYIVDKIVSDENVISYEGKREVVDNIMDATTAQKMRELMHKANYEGLSKMWQPSKVSMGIKTGTAQIASPKGGYLKGEYDSIYSLMGIFPEENPEYLMYASVKQIEGPQKAFANVVVKAVDEVAAYKDLGKSDEPNNEENGIYIENYNSLKVEEVKDKINNVGLIPVIIGTGEYIVNQYPYKDTKIISNSKVFLKTNNNEIMLPNFTSWSISDVKKYCMFASISCEYSGKGFAVAQSIPENTKIADEKIVITFSD